MDFTALQEKIEGYREALMAEAREIKVVDYGAGDPKNARSKESMQAGVEVVSDTSKMARIGLKGDSLLRVLKIITEMRPKVILELGTCCGFSSSYMSCVTQDTVQKQASTQIHTIEGASEIAKIARETHRILGCENVTCHVGRFVDVLPSLLPQIAPIDFVFIDGHHDKDATIGYFRQILPFMSKRGGVMVFDDISWSEGMAEAWREIVDFGAHKRVESDHKVGVLWL